MIIIKMIILMTVNRIFWENSISLPNKKTSPLNIIIIISSSILRKARFSKRIILTGTYSNMKIKIKIIIVEILI